MVKLFAAWKDSLSLLQPKNLKLFMLVSVNSLVKGYGVFIGYPLLIISLATGLWLTIHTFMRTYVLDAPAGAVLLSDSLQYDVLGYGIAFLWCASIHPSMTRKDARYFSVNGALSPLMFYTAALFSRVLFTGDHTNITNPLILAIAYSICAFWSLFMTFFSFDSDKTLKSMVLAITRSAKMLVYNAPLLVLVTLSFFAITYALKNVIAIVPLSTSIATLIYYAIIIGLLTPFTICVINNIYIKKLYDNKSLYL